MGVSHTPIWVYLWGVCVCGGGGEGAGEGRGGMCEYVWRTRQKTRVHNVAVTYPIISTARPCSYCSWTRRPKTTGLRRS